MAWNIFVIMNFNMVVSIIIFIRNPKSNKHEMNFKYGNENNISLGFGSNKIRFMNLKLQL